MLATPRDCLHPLIIAPVAFLLAAFGVGLFFSGYADILYAPAGLFLLAAAVTALIPALWRGGALPTNMTAAALAAFCVFVTVSLFWSTIPFASLITYLVLLALPLSYAALLVPDTRRALLTAATASFLLALAGLAIWAVIQITLLRDIYGDRAHHPLDDANNLAALFNLGLLPALALFLTREKKGRLHAASLALLLILFAGLLATQSRSGILGFLIAAALLCAILKPVIRKNVKTMGLALAAGLLVLVLMQLFGLVELDLRLSTLAHPAADHAIMARLAIWNATAAMIAEHPFRGTGLGTFYMYYPPHRAPLLDNSTGSWAHMDSLQFWAEMGVMAPLLFYGFLLCVLKKTHAALRRTDADAPERAAIAGLFCALLAVLVQSHVGFPLYIMPILIVCGVWLAALYLVTADDEFVPIAFDRPWERPVMAGSLLCVALLLVLMNVSSAAGQYFLQRALTGIRAGQTATFIDNIERAQLYAPASFIDPEVQMAGLHIDILAAPDALFSKEEQKTMFDTTLAMLDEAEKMNPAWAEIDHKRAMLHATASYELTPEGDTQALIHWQRALAKNPLHFRARVELAQRLVRQGNPAAAYDLLAAGLEFPHNQDVETGYRAILEQIATVAALQKARMKELNRP